jgi:hypothetical protein
MDSPDHVLLSSLPYLLQFGVLSSFGACTYFIIPVRNVTLASRSSEELKFRPLGLVPPSVASAAPKVFPRVTDRAQTIGTITETHIS